MKAVFESLIYSNTKLEVYGSTIGQVTNHVHGTLQLVYWVRIIRDAVQEVHQ